MFYRNAEKLFPGTERPTRALPPADDPSRDDVKRVRSTVDAFSHALTSNSSNKTSRSAAIPRASGPGSDSIGAVDLVGYSSSVKKVQQYAESASIFDASKPPEKWIDFNEVAPSPMAESKSLSRTVVPLPDQAQQPALKKRKITIVSDAQKAKYEQRKLEQAEALPDEAASSSHQSKKELATNYLKSVKGSLSPSSYASFSALTSNYRRDKDIDALLAALSKLFLKENSLQHLFRGETCIAPQILYRI